MNKKLLALLAFATTGLFSAHAQNLVNITSDITTDTTWTASNQYIINGTIKVKGNSTFSPTLTIQPGTIIRTQPNALNGNSTIDFNPGVIVVTTTGKINAQGSAANPIIFTTAAIGNPSAATPTAYVQSAFGSGSTAYLGVTTTRAVVSGGSLSGNTTFWDANPKTAPKAANISGLGGGLVILGKAVNNFGPINTTSASLANAAASTTTQTQHTIEGFSNLGTDGLHGGNDDNDNSGVLSYVSIRHQGASVLANNELNGLSLGSVGRGTKIDHIEIWGNLDDGIEVWGGTVNLSYLMITHPKDDGLDIDLGYRGTVQFACVIGGKDTDKLSEIDGDDFLNDGQGTTPYRMPYCSAQFWNMTLIGCGLTPNELVTTGNGAGIHVRRGAAVTISNTIVTNLANMISSFNTGSKVWARQQSDRTVTFRNVLVPSGALNSQAAGNDASTSPVIANSVTNLYTSDPVFGNTFAFDSAGDFTAINPLPFGDDVTNAAAQPAGLGLSPAAYLGAFDPSFLTLWTDSWTAASKGNRLSATLE
jgi:hypothetical protein